MRLTKTLSLLAAILLLVSCARSSKNAPKIGVALPSFSDPSSSAFRQAIEIAALDKAQLTEIDGQGQQPAQDLQLESLFDQKPSALAIGAVEASAVDGIIAKAKALKIPLVLFGALPSEEAMRSWDRIYFVGSRDRDSGYAQGEIVAAAWKADKGADRDKDGSLRYVVIGEESDKAPRAEGFAQAMAAAGIKAEPLAMGLGAEAAIALGAKVEAAICVSRESTLGAVERYQAARKAKDGRTPIIVGSLSGERPPEIAGALASGLLAGIAVPDEASRGKAVFDLAYALARGINASKSGWKVVDAKYVWVQYEKIGPGAQQPLSKK